MNKRILSWIAVPLVALGVSSNSHASVTCLSPDPICVTVVISGLIVGIAAAHDDEPEGLEVAADGAATDAALRAIRSADDERLRRRFDKAVDGSPGLQKLLGRFARNGFAGHRSLASLVDSDPQIIDDLDRIEDLIEAHSPRREVVSAYGPKYVRDGRINWEHYATLARDAVVIRRELAGQQ